MGLLVGAFGVTAFAADSQKVVDVTSVQKVLEQTHATWHAKESWVTRLSKDEIHRMLGLKKAPVGTLDYEGIRTQSNGKKAFDASSAIDWRNRNGVNFLGPVMNQGNCGSCVAFSTIATLEAQTSISAGVPWLHPTYSPQDLFACGGASCESGWEPDDAAQFLQNTGVVDEACMPYTEGSTGVDAACSSKCSDADSRTFKIAGYTTPTNYGGSVDDVKAALAKGPLVTTLMVYYDFLTYGGGVYKHATGDAAGGHAISIVGFDDSKRAWLIRNSWGAEWGENGFGWVSYDDISGVGANTWGFEIPSGPALLSVQSPTDREFVSGAYQLVAKGTGLSRANVQFHLTGDNGRDAIPAVSCLAATSDGTCSASLDTTQLKEGRYEIFADTGGSKSQVREFFVLNHEPKLSLSFTPVDGVDLTQPLNGRPEFNIVADGGAVPIQHVEFRAIDSSGKIAAIKGNDYVLPQMRMGWRTVTVPDGKYTILFHGQTTYNGKVYSVDSNSYSITVKN
jgi:C1A family cysteine protease